MSQASRGAWYNIFQHASGILGCGAACSTGILDKKEWLTETIQPYRGLAAGPLQQRRSPFGSEIVDAGDYRDSRPGPLHHGVLSRARASKHELLRILVLLWPGLKQCRGAMGKNVASTLVCDKLDQSREKNGSGNRSQVLGGTMHRASKARSREFRNSPEFRVRRAEYRRCGYSPPRRPSANGRGWPQAGQRKCWGSKERS